MSAAPFDCDVLVVGLGPVGAVLTALLAERGVRVIAIERDTEPYPLPRAVHFDHEIMRIFQQLGVAEPIRRHARDLPDYEFRAADGRVLMKLRPPRQTPSGWGGGYMFHQPGLEAVLRERLAALPHADIRLGQRLDALAQDADSVGARVTTPTGAAAIRARYLVGCDGAWSLVREAVGGGLFDYAFDEPWLVVDVQVPAGCTVPAVNIQLCDPARPTTCVLSGPGRHRWEFMLLPGETPEAMMNDAVVQGLIRPWDCGPVEIERKAVYRFHGLVANRWRAGRIMIAGDAAHQTPPFAGQGMCAGIRDAANLTWKLDSVLRGTASAALLDTYQAEREPHVRSAIELAIGMGRVVCTLDRDAAAQRDAAMLTAQAGGAPALPPTTASPFASGCVLAGSPGAGEMFPQPTAGGESARLRMDDRLGDGACLIARTPVGEAAAGVRLLDVDADALAPFRASLLAWLDQHEADAVLVRPDRYVFGSGAPRRLLDAWAASLRPEAPRLAETARMMTVEPANPRAVRTKAALMAAGRRLLSQHPIDAVTVDDIVQAAEVGKGSFYNHFADREALARAIATQIRASIEGAVARANAGIDDPARRLARAVCTYLRFALDEPEQAGVLVHIHSGHTSLNAPLNRGLVEDLETGLAMGRFEVATVESGALYVLGVTQLALVRIVQEQNQAFAVSLSQQMCALVLRGLGIQGPEADRIAAQVSDAIVRKNA